MSTKAETGSSPYHQWPSDLVKLFHFEERIYCNSWIKNQESSESYNIVKFKTVWNRKFPHCLVLFSSGKIPLRQKLHDQQFEKENYVDTQFFFLKLQREKIENKARTNQWSAALQPYSLNLQRCETKDSFDYSYISKFSSQIMAETCQHWHTMGRNHLMSMLVEFCQDLAEYVEI